MSDNFFLDISSWAKKAEGRLDQITRKVVLDVGTRLVMRSPVGDPSIWQSAAPKGYTGGHFRGNWQYGEGFIPQGALATVDKSGRASIARLKPSAKPGGKVHYIVNNLPYAMALERGHSKQAPQGIVGLTVMEFRPIVEKVALELKNRGGGA